ncbi:hypothetical protein PISMIDRAFT_15853 [Pisolithus microcarpus 441]|uniref:Myb-like domain-containing protein n=1 Tax=Pisolithus microcarpus 441 TaxID=765257 RepID=A0A0C9YRA6_9AGAM|nr:hypothetical protein PISMIDRAFT_15853 [Pisolithus microcarpus 441]
MPRISAQSPTKRTSPSSQAGGVQVSWSEADTITLLDLVVAHKASAGEGLNFKATFWNTAAAHLGNPSKGAPKTAKACKDKWKRLRKTYDAVDQLCSRSGFMYSLKSGANIGIENDVGSPYSLGLNISVISIVITALHHFPQQAVPPKSSPPLHSQQSWLVRQLPSLTNAAAT